jgi:hypothetical protein
LEHGRSLNSFQRREADHESGGQEFEPLRARQQFQ